MVDRGEGACGISHFTAIPILGYNTPLRVQILRMETLKSDTRDEFMPSLVC